MAQKRVVHSRTKKTDDIEIHVCTVETEHGQYTDIREYVVSLEQYGRGITFPAALASDILRGVYYSTGLDIADLVEMTSP